MSESKIEWTDVTWNPLAGCTYVSEGCRFCYAATMTRRLEAMGQADYAGLTTAKRFNGKIRLRPDKLAEPLKWRKPRRVFVNSMSDLFHKDVPDEFIAAVFGIMAACPLHTFQILTKRADRLASWSLAVQAEGGIGRYIRDNEDRRKVFRSVFGKVQKTAVFYGKMERADDDPWMLVMNAAACNYGTAALSNVWLGVSVENQAAADERIPHLLRTPAAVRFLSCEPLISAVDVQQYLQPGGSHAEYRRNGSSIVSGAGCDKCRRGGPRVAASGNNARLGNRRTGSSLQEATGRCREINERRVSESPGDSRQEEICGSGAPHRVDGIESENDTDRLRNQPQRRREAQQQARQLGSRDARAECDPLTSLSWPLSQSQGDGRETKPGSGFGDSPIVRQQNHAACPDCGTVWRIGCEREAYSESQQMEVGSVISWVIVGGESGPGARPCNVDWIRAIRDQCSAARVPCFVKQLGSRPFTPHPGIEWREYDYVYDHDLELSDRKGGDPAEWPEDLRVREYPTPAACRGA